MASKTTNYNLHKIDLTDAPPDITVLNQNWDTIDEKLKLLSEDSGVVISATEPTTGDIWIDTDDDSFNTYSQTEINNLLATKAPAYDYSTTDLTAGTSALETGKIYLVYE